MTAPPAAPLPLFALRPQWRVHFHDDDSCVAFHPHSGDILALAPGAGVVLRVLRDGPASIAELAERLQTLDTTLRTDDCLTHCQHIVDELLASTRLIERPDSHETR